MINKLIREEARRLPVLAPPAGWQEADWEDLLNEFLADRLKPVTANLLAQASDDDSVGRLLRTSIRYWLIDQSRETAVVSLGRSLKNVLTDSDAFETVPSGEEGVGRWRLSGTTAQPWSGPFDRLIQAAYAVPNVKIPKWTSETRRAPVADRASIQAVIQAVLSTAAGSMEVAQLVEVFTARFPVVLDPVVVPLPDDEGSQITADAHASAEEIAVAREDEDRAATAGAGIVAMLSPQERRMVPYLDRPGEIQTLLGCGRSQAYHHAACLKEKLRQLVGDGDEVRSVRLEVIRLCSEAVETR